MKGEGEELVVACGQMATTVSPASASASASVNSLAQRPFPTPSPFSVSIASTGWSCRRSMHVTTLILRFLVLVFSFVSAVSLAAPSSKKNGQSPPSSFNMHELMYPFVVYILVFLYSAFQLFKGICDISHRGILISDKVSDYLSFILDQLAGYLLISSCSVAIMVIKKVNRSESPWKVTLVAISMSFAAFLVILASTIYSGYKLCKRIIW